MSKLDDGAMVEHESEQRYRSLVEHSPLGVVVHQGGEIVFVNASACRILGGTAAEQFLGKSAMSFVHEEDRVMVAKQVAMVDDGRESAVSIEERLVRLDGQVVYVEVMGSTVEYGGAPASQWVFFDVTERHVARDALRRSEAMFRALIEQSGDGIVVADNEDRYIIVNPRICQMTGFSQEELLSMRVSDLVSPTQSLSLLPRVAAGEQGTIECELRRQDGSSFAAEVSGYPISIDGDLVALGIVRDITQRRQDLEDRLGLESKIQKAQKLESLGVLAGGIAHDFNNLLVGILGNAGLALLDLPPEAPSRQYVHHIETTAIRAAELIQQMLAYSGKGHFLVERLHLEAVVSQMTHLLEIAISKKAVLKFDFAPDVPAVEADATQLRQLVANLVLNASEAIGDRSGVISVCTGAMECDLAYLSETYLDDEFPEGVYSYIEVSDSGCGMDSATLARIFDPFFTTKFTGRGLGLAAVLGIVRGHKGAIKVSSERTKGTTIKVLFPAVQSGLSRRPSDPPPLAPDDSFCGVALLVDDEETVRAVGKSMLERLGFEVDTACDGREALELFSRDPSRYLFVLLDLTMPRLGGEECFRELRRIRKDVVVVLSSGYNEQELVTRFAGQGLAGFVQKPYRLQYLAAKIEDALAKR